MASFINNTDTLRNILEIINNLQETTDAINAAISSHDTSSTAHYTMQEKLTNATTLLKKLNSDVSRLYNEQEEILEKLELSSGSLQNLEPFFRIEDRDIEMGDKDSQYKLQVGNEGVEILQGNSLMSHIGQNAISAPAIEAAHTIKVGNYTAKVTTSGVLMFN